VPAVYDLALVIAEIISAHCRGTSARERFLQACIGSDWGEAVSMIDGMLAEPWHLKGHQERRLREFLGLVSAARSDQTSADQTFSASGSMSALTCLRFQREETTLRSGPARI
jgi:hypothetical protein